MTLRRIACWVASWCTVMQCSCTDQITNPLQADAGLNADSPSSNALISRERLGGDPSRGSQWLRLLEVGDGTWLSFGIENSTYVVARLGADGAPLWTRTAGYTVRGAALVSETWLAAVVTVGTFDTDNDGQDDEARLTLWGPDGTRLDEIALAPGRVRSANDVTIAGTAADHVDLLVVGYGQSSPDGSEFPWVVRAAVLPGGALSSGAEHAYPTPEPQSFRCVVRDNGGTGGYYVGGNVLDETAASVNGFVERLSDSLSVEWRTDLVVTPGFRTWLGRRGSICWTGSSLIAVGESEVVKSTVPSDGAYWHAGLVASLSPLGQVEWLQTVSLTQHGEGFSSCWMDGDFVYAVGWAAAYWSGSSRQTFGYGLISALHASDGSPTAHFTFGDPSVESGFVAGIVHGNRAQCVGWTSQTTLTSGYQSWFVDIDFTRPRSVFSTAARTDVDAGGPELSASNHAIGWMTEP